MCEWLYYCPTTSTRYKSTYLGTTMWTRGDVIRKTLAYSLNFKNAPHLHVRPSALPPCHSSSRPSTHRISNSPHLHSVTAPHLRPPYLHSTHLASTHLPSVHRASTHCTPTHRTSTHRPSVYRSSTHLTSTHYTHRRCSSPPGCSWIPGARDTRSEQSEMGGGRMVGGRGAPLARRERKTPGQTVRL